MPISDMLRLGTAGNLTNQQIADMALEADRQARRAYSRPDGEIAALPYIQERDALCALLSDPTSH